MSPSEDDLRNALHHGEGERLDVDRVVAAGHTRRAARRTRLATVAATVVLVAAAGGVTGALLSGGDDTRTSAERDDPSGGYSVRAPEPVPPTSSGEQGRIGGGPGGGIQAPPRVDTSCPASFPQRLLPGGGSPGQFGSGDRLFATTPVAVLVCSYGPPAEQRGAASHRLLTEADSAALVGSLESASTKPPACDGPGVIDTGGYAFIGITSDGKAMRVVTTQLTKPACGERTTNGTAVRWNWTPSSEVQQLLPPIGSSGPAVTTAPTPGRNIGSPPR